ncbi:MAG: cytidine deaminase [Bacteroidota bacterium]|nr:cytidine deaminase [Bacteroidota bacterium]
MEKHTLNIDYNILQIEDLSLQDRELMDKAKEELKNSYSPYSHFKVACAIRTKSGKIFVGCNQENVAYPSGLCAERVALFSVGAKKEIPQTLFIVAKNEKNETSTAFPCGACRQVMAEFQNFISKQDIKIMLLTQDEKILSFKSVNDLLPFTFEL